ncbi:MAG: competence/damage-inducible protein A [Eubacteriaceae bacterium]|jgi:nicotinamide-nucleotide amidase
MNCELISVGTEILTGAILNTNARWLSEELSGMGINVRRETTVGDNPDRLEQSLRNAVEDSQLVILTGGLGPTQDDLTKETAARVFNKAMQLHPEIAEELQKWFEQRGFAMTENNLSQAMIPEGSTILPNPNGTAPGILIEGEVGGEHKMVFLLPGPPKEMTAMFDAQVRPLLSQKSGQAVVSHYYHLTGIGESAAEDALLDLIDGQTNPTLATYAKPDQVLVRLTASADTDAQAERLLEEYDKIIQERLSAFIFTESRDTLIEAVGGQLLEQNQTIATAESCTGGLVSAELARIPGISASLKAGIVTYCNEMKEELLGVSHETLEQFGAVSPETAREMCEHARRITGADIGVSTTGIAGPGGAVPGKPVGLVYTGISTAHGTKILKNQFYGSRTDIQQRTVNRVMQMIREELGNLKR